MAETVTKRLHVGGLTPSITPDHLRDRFRSFGTVTDVEAMGLDAVGQPRPFAFLTIETTPAQLRKCLNIMSGAMWRGTQLRIAEAKPRWDAKLVAERIPVAREARRATNRLRRAVAREGGRHAQDMRLVTAASKSKSQFWVDDNGHLIRPLSMRPDRPLLPLPRTDAHAAPPARAYRRVIDPRRWGAAHLAGAEMDAGEVEAADAALGEWEFVDADADEEEDDEGRTLVGWWRRGDDEVAVRLRRPRGDGEDEFDVDDVSDLFPAREGSPLFSGREDSPLFPAHAESPLFPARGESPLFPTREGEAETRGSSPLFPSRDAEASSPLFPARAGVPTDAEPTTSPLFPARDLASSAPASTDASSPLFPSRLLPSRIAELVDDDEMMRSSRATTPSPSPTRIFEVSRAMSLEPVLRKLVTPEASHPPSSGATSDAQLASESSHESPESSDDSEPTPEPTPHAQDHPPAHTLDVPDAVRAAVAAERNKDLGVLASLLGTANAPTRARAEFAGFADDDSDDGDYSALCPVADDDDDDEPVELARASAPSPDTPRYTAFEHEDEPVDADEEMAEVPPVNVELPPMGSDSGSTDSSDAGTDAGTDSDSGSEDMPVDADKPVANGGKSSSSSSRASSTSSSGSSSSSSGSSDSGSSDAAAPNGAGGAGDGSDPASGSGSSDSGDSDDSDSGSDDDSSSGSDDDSDSSDSDDDDDSDSDSSDSDSSDSSDSDTNPNPAPSAPTGTTLKDMFTTAPTAFSLGALAPDLELDDTLDVPLPTAAEPELALLPAAPKSTFDADAGVPLFFPLPVRPARRGEARSVFVPEDEGEEEEEGEGYGQGYGGGYGHGGHGDEGQGDAGHAGHAGPSGSSGPSFAPARPQPPAPKRGFWADESDADMKRRWEARRLELTRGWKRKHREAVKHRRRRGGDDAE